MSESWEKQRLAGSKTVKFGLSQPRAGAGDWRRNRVVLWGLWPTSFRGFLRSAGMGWPAANLVFGSPEIPAKLLS